MAIWCLWTQFPNKNKKGLKIHLRKPTFGVPKSWFDWFDFTLLIIIVLANLGDF